MRTSRKQISFKKYLIGIYIPKFFKGRFTLVILEDRDGAVIMRLVGPIFRNNLSNPKRQFLPWSLFSMVFTHSADVEFNGIIGFRLFRNLG